MQKKFPETIESVGVLVFPGVEELDFVGPWEMLTMWRTYADGPSDIFTVAEATSVLSCAKGLKIVPDKTLKDCGQVDVLLVPGGFAALDVAKNNDVISFIKRQAKGASYILSVCSGAFILAAAGLLAGKKATTHWKALKQLAAIDGVELVETRFVSDGSVWTSGGVSAGVDMTLAFIAHAAGEDAASIVQLNAEYYPNGHLYGDHHKSADAPDYIKSAYIRNM